MPCGWRAACRPLVDRFAGFDAARWSAPLAGRSYEIGVVEHSWCAPYLASDRRRLPPHGARPAQRGIRAARALRGRRRAAPTGLAHRVFGEASARFEAEWLPRFAEVLAPSGRRRARRAPSPRRPRCAVYPERDSLDRRCRPRQTSR